MEKDQRHVRSMNRKCFFFSLFYNLLLGWFSVYPLRFEPEQSVSLDLGWGEGRGGEGRVGQGYSVHAFS